MSDSREPGKLRAFLSGGLISVGASLLIGIGGYLVRRIFAETLSVEDYAALYSLVALGTLAASILRFGSADLLLFVLSGRPSPESDPDTPRLFGNIARLNLKLFLPLTAILALYVSFGGTIPGVSVPRAALLLFLPFLLLTTFDALFNYLFNALKAFSIQYGTQTLKTALMLLGAILAAGTLNGAVLTFTVPPAIYILLSLILLKKTFRFGFGPAAPPESLKLYRTRCFWLFLLSLSPMIFNELPTALLSFFSSPRQVAFFNIAVPVAMIVRTFYCVAMVFVPFAGEMKNSGDLRRLSLYILGSAGCSLLAGLVMIPVFYLFGRDLIRLLFGETYADAAFCSFLLSEAMTIAFSGQVNINTLNTLGCEKHSAWVTLLTALLVLGGSIPLGLAYGAEGVAAGCLAGAFLWSAVSAAVLLKHIRTA